MHIHITGASGTGATSLGKALAAQMSLRHLDADSYYWLPTSPPFKVKRAPAERLALLTADMNLPPGTVLSGSVVGRGSEVEAGFDLVVFLYLPAELRASRLREREIARYGAADPAFLEWAAQYDQGPPEGRSLKKHEAWLAGLLCPVLRLDLDQTVEERVRSVGQALLNSSPKQCANGDPRGPSNR